MAQDVTIKIQFKVLQDLERQLKFANKTFAKLEKDAKKAADGIGRVEQGFKRLGGAIATFVGARALFNFTKSAVTGFAQFEKAVIEVNTLLPETQKNVKGLTKQLSALSVEFGTDRIQQAKGLYQTISSGFVDAAEAAEILRASNILALGGLTDTRTAVSGVTAVLKSYGKGAESAERVTDIFFQTIKNARTTAEELGSSISVVTGLGANLGISFESLSAALGTLTLNGTDTATAAVQLRQILASILKPSAEAATEAKRLGIEFNAAAVKSQGLGKFLLDLRKKLEGNDDSVAKLFGNVRALSGIIQLTSGDLENYNKLLKDNENAHGAAAKAANEVKKSLQFKLDKLNAQWTALKDVVGEGLVDAFFKAGQAYEDMIKKLSKSQGFFSNLAKGFLATIGINVDKQAKAPSVFSDVSTPTKASAGGAPITPGPSIDPDFELAKALDIPSFGEQIKAALTKSFEAAASVFDLKNIAGFLKGGAAGATALAKSVGNSIGAAFGVPGAGELVELLSLPPEKFKELIDQFFKAIPQIVNAIATNIPVLIQAFVDNIDPIIDALVGAIPLITQKLLELLVDPNFWVSVMKAFLSVLTLGIFDSFKPVIDLFKLYFLPLRTAISIFSSAVGSFSGVVNFFKGVIDDLKGLIPGLGGGGGIPIVGDVVKGVKSFFGFENGVDIPNLSKYRNDGFGGVSLSAGEAVLDAPTARRLNRFLDNIGSNNESVQPIVVQTQIGENQLAETIVNLGLKGYRLGGAF